MYRSLTLASLLLLSASSARADELGASPSDPGRITVVDRGVKELDVGGIFVLSHDKIGDQSDTRMSTMMGAGFQVFINTNLSVGGTALFNYDRAGDSTSARALGGVAFASAHLRLGLGAFLRPMIGIGALFGQRELSAAAGLVSERSQHAFLTRIGMPFAYFPSKRVVLQAGPEIDISLGSFDDGAGGSTSFTTISSGFAVGLGYAF